MINKWGSHSGLFLVEMIIAIMMFAISGGVCMTVFAGASKLSNESNNIKNATFNTQSVAECLKAYDIQQVENMFNLNKQSDSIYVIDYNNDWQQSGDSNNGVFEMIINLSEKDRILTAKILVNDKRLGQVLYQLDVNKYITYVKED